MHEPVLVLIPVAGALTTVGMALATGRLLSRSEATLAKPEASPHDEARQGGADDAEEALRNV